MNKQSPKIQGDITPYQIISSSQNPSGYLMSGGIGHIFNVLPPSLVQKYASLESSEKEMIEICYVIKQVRRDIEESLHEIFLSQAYWQQSIADFRNNSLYIQNISNINEAQKEGDYHWYAMPKASTDLQCFLDTELKNYPQGDRYYLISIMAAQMALALKGFENFGKYHGFNPSLILHGDIKPSNVLLYSYENSDIPHLKLTDFNAFNTGNKDVNNSLLMSNSNAKLMQTSLYMSPEQSAVLYGHLDKNELNIQSDMYSYGLVLAQMSGAMVLPGGRFQLPQGLPSTLTDFINKCTHQEKQKRFPSVTELVDGVKALVFGFYKAYPEHRFSSLLRTEFYLKNICESSVSLPVIDDTIEHTPEISTPPVDTGIFFHEQNVEVQGEPYEADVDTICFQLYFYKNYIQERLDFLETCDEKIEQAEKELAEVEGFISSFISDKLEELNKFGLTVSESDFESYTLDEKLLSVHSLFSTFNSHKRTRYDHLSTILRDQKKYHNPKKEKKEKKSFFASLFGSNNPVQKEITITEMKKASDKEAVQKECDDFISFITSYASCYFAIKRLEGLREKIKIFDYKNEKEQRQKDILEEAKESKYYESYKKEKKILGQKIMEFSGFDISQGEDFSLESIENKSFRFPQLKPMYYDRMIELEKKEKEICKQLSKFRISFSSFYFTLDKDKGYLAKFLASSIKEEIFKKQRKSILSKKPYFEKQLEYLRSNLRELTEFHKTSYDFIASLNIGVTEIEKGFSFNNEDIISANNLITLSESDQIRLKKLVKQKKLLGQKLHQVVTSIQEPSAQLVEGNFQESKTQKQFIALLSSFMEKQKFSYFVAQKNRYMKIESLIGEDGFLNFFRDYSNQLTFSFKEVFDFGVDNAEVAMEEAFAELSFGVLRSVIGSNYRNKVKEQAKLSQQWGQWVSRFDFSPLFSVLEKNKKNLGDMYIRKEEYDKDSQSYKSKRSKYKHLKSLEFDPFKF